MKIKVWSWAVTRLSKMGIITGTKKKGSGAPSQANPGEPPCIYYKI